MSHLTHEQRSLIENGLRSRKSFREIAATIGKFHSTVSREILAHRVDSDKGAYGRVTNRCVFRRDCSRVSLCHPSCGRKCSACAKCNSVCPAFQEECCARLEQVPYVCNGCTEEHRCVLRKKDTEKSSAKPEAEQC